MYSLEHTDRNKEFSHLKSNIRGSRRHLIVGIDVAKDKHDAFFGTANGQTLLKHFKFKNSLEGFNNFLQKTESVKLRHELKEVVFALEPTANYHKPLGEFLVKNEHCLVLVSPGAAKKNRELLTGRWDKSDSNDPANIADLTSQGKFLFYDFPSAPVRDLKALLSLKRKLKKDIHSRRMRIRNHLLAQYFPELDSSFGRFDKENLSIVKWILDPAEISKIDFDSFFKMVTTRNQGARQKNHLKSIWQSAPDSIGCEVGEAARYEGKILVDSLLQAQEATSETNTKIKTICEQLPEYASLLSIPGFGPVISGMTLGAIGNPHRFSNTKQVLKMVGLDLSASRSGKSSSNATPKISKKGTAELRYALYQAALVASTRNPHFKRYFEKLIKGREKEKGIKKKMRVKLSAKMLVIAWTLMKNGEMFDPSRL